MAVLGCSWMKGSAPVGGVLSSPNALPQIVQYDVKRRPKLVTLIREGDPQAALALVLGPLSTVEQSIHLAALLNNRLRGSSYHFEVLPRLGGVTVVATFDVASAARPLAVQLDQALRANVSSLELTQPGYQTLVQQLRRAAAFQISDAERAVCLGESADRNQSDVDAEQVRRSVFSESQARWGVVGERRLVDAVDAAVRGLDAWPRNRSSFKGLPSQNRPPYFRAGPQLPHLDVVWWSPNVRRGLVAKRSLKSNSGLLSQVLPALAVPMRLDRVSVTPQRFGNCVALSLSPADPGMPVGTEDLTYAARVSVELLKRFDEQPTPDEAATLAVVDEADPRIAAELAAQLSIALDSEGDDDRYGVDIDVGAGSTLPTAGQQRAVFAGAARSSVLQLVRAVEPGQGRLYALIASPCATWSESRRTVGTTSLFLRTLATRYQETQGVVFEPWVTPAGAGLIAHAVRLSATESPERQARRLGDALGRLLTTQQIDVGELWNVRSSLLAQVGPGPRPALWHAILSLSPTFPGLVATDGQFSSVEAAALTTVQERRAEFLRLPLRLAVIENASNAQGDTMRAAVADWVSLFRAESIRCPDIGTVEPLRSGVINFESKTTDPNDAGSTIVLALPAQEPQADAHATLLQWLLGRTTGWLAQRLRSSNAVASVEAKVLGGSIRRGLVIAVAGPPSAMNAASLSLHNLLQDLGSGILPESASIALAIGELQLEERRRRMDPKVRVVDLWLSRGQEVAIDEVSFREYLKRAFGSPNLIEVRTARGPAVAGRAKH